MELETVLYSVDDGIARITMNRADKRNALNHRLLDDLDRAFSAAEEDDAVGVVVLSGSGPSFCAGYDLKGSYYTSVPEPEGKWTVGNSLKKTAVPASDLASTVDGIARDCLAVPRDGQLHNKEALNTALEILGVGALFRYHGQMNALGRLRDRGDDDGFDRFR